MPERSVVPVSKSRQKYRNPDISDVAFLRESEKVLKSKYLQSINVQYVWVPKKLCVITY